MIKEHMVYLELDQDLNLKPFTAETVPDFLQGRIENKIVATILNDALINKNPIAVECNMFYLYLEGNRHPDKQDQIREIIEFQKVVLAAMIAARK